MISLLSSPLPKRTEAMKAHVLVFHAGLSEISTTTRPPTCGSIAHTVATFTTEENSSERFLPLLRVTSSPASLTWKLTPYLLLRMIRYSSRSKFSFSCNDTFRCNLSIIVFFCQEPMLAFDGVIASELYPCVLFYSSNPGEKVLGTVLILALTQNSK